MVLGGAVVLVALRWMPWIVQTDGITTIEGSTYGAIYGGSYCTSYGVCLPFYSGSLWMPLMYIGGAITASFLKTHNQRQLVQWLGIVVIAISLGGLWVLFDRALPEIDPTPGMTWNIALANLLAIGGIVVALPGTATVTIWAWVNRKS